jgi:response regulator RpfG family c-di-GMP phosphodiesterase
MNAPNTTKATLLLVDDEPGILASLRRLLRPAGYHILTAESGKAGLEILEHEAVNLVISDMRMPEMDGARFLEQVRIHWPETTRILLTGYADVGATIDAINRGEIYRYIAKPWDDNDLTLIVRDALDRQLLIEENSRLLALTQAQNEELKDLNANLEDKVKQRTAEIEQINSFLNLANDTLKQNFLVSIKVFSGLMELRGGAMSGHSRRVAVLARQLATKLGLPANEQQDIFFAALLHDIGKIGFSDTLLSRPVSRMNGDELGQYRKHVLAGESALMPLEEMKEVARIIRSHHERFDGQGFPDGLEGQNIPFGARILSLINDYDGLQIGTLSDKKMSSDEAKALLLQARGKRYDPQIMDAFLDLLGNIGREIANEKLVSYPDLKVGMVLARDLVSREGVLLLAVDFVLNVAQIKQIHDYAHRENHALTIYIRTDKH